MVAFPSFILPWQQNTLRILSAQEMWGEEAYSKAANSFTTETKPKQTRP